MTNNDPFISVIVPNYNHEAYLNQRIESILNQTYQNFELIILDDCSTDESMSIINKFSDHSKVSITLVNEKNSGSTFKQWQKGLSIAKGELIWIAESDDVAEATFLELMLPAFNKTNTVLCYCNSRIIDQNNDMLQQVNNWMVDLNPNKWSSNHTEKGTELLSNYLRYRNVIANASSVVFRKEAFSKINFKYEDYKYSGDWLFWSLMSQLGDIAYISEPLNLWRSHPNTTRRIQDIENEAVRLKETIGVMNFIRTNLLPNESFNKKKYYWIVDWWLRRFTFKNMLKKNYISIEFPFFLKVYFLRKLFVIFIRESGKSMIKKLTFK